MEEKNIKIGFALISIKTEQFASIEENFVEGGNINLGSGLSFGFEKEQHAIAIFPKFTFECNGKLFLTIETSSHFSISPEDWESFFNNDTGLITVPKNFMQHLCVISIGTARGVLHAKTENTLFNRFLLPTINVTEMITDDIIENLTQD